MSRSWWNRAQRSTADATAGPNAKFGSRRRRRALTVAAAASAATLIAVPTSLMLTTANWSDAEYGTHQFTGKTIPPPSFDACDAEVLPLGLGAEVTVTFTPVGDFADVEWTLGVTQGSMIPADPTDIDPVSGNPGQYVAIFDSALITLLGSGGFIGGTTSETYTPENTWTSQTVYVEISIGPLGAWATCDLL